MIDSAGREGARALARSLDRDADPARDRSSGRRGQISLLRRTAHAVMLTWGWRRCAIACAAGAVSALAMAPFFAWPVLLITFPLLVWLIDGAAGPWGRPLGAMLVGWCFGFGYFVAGLYWIGIAFLVDAKTFAWLIPFAVLGLPAYLALFTGFGAALAALMWTRGPTRILALAGAMTIAEWLRGHALTGFPWNAFGYALTEPLALAQAASLIGLWGLTFITVAIVAAPAALADDPDDTRRRWMPLLLAAAALTVMAIFGVVRLSDKPTRFVEGIKLRIMQPDLPQDLKFNYAARHDVMKRYLSLSDKAAGPQQQGMRDVTHLIWPESAFPFLLTREPEALAQIAALLPPGAVLITGAARAADAEPDGRLMHAYNSIYVIDHDGSISAVYDKVHLVPFGEYLPFQSLLESLGLSALTKQRGGFLSGDRRRPLAVPHAPAAWPLVCYEIIFPGDDIPLDEKRPRWLLNLTNDGWFGDSTGPPQHFQQARVRAIEEGLPLVRAANTGISAVVDPLGRIVRSLPVGTEGVIDAGLPAPLPPTVFARFGDSSAVVLLVVAFGFCAGARRRERLAGTRRG